MQILPYSPGYRAGVLACFRSNVPKSFAEEEEADFMAFVESGKGEYFVGVVDDSGRAILGSGGAVGDSGEMPKVVACAGVARRGNVGDLCWGLVHADWQGQGLGARLLEYRLRVLLGWPIETVRLETSQHTETFFARYGFRVADRVPNGYAPGLDQVEMTAPASDLERALTRIGEIDL